jgi:type IV secretory pathway component VirB8
MHEFSPDEARRWDAWQRANVRSERRRDHLCRVVGAAVFAALLVALAIAVWLR